MQCSPATTFRGRLYPTSSICFGSTKATASLTAQERLLPDGSMELVVNLNEDEARVYDRRNPSQFQAKRGALLVGVQSEFFVIGAFPFFNLPAGEFHNQHLSLDLGWGNVARELRDRLLEAPTPERKF